MNTLLWAMLWLLAIGALVGLQLAISSRAYRIRRYGDQVHFARTDDGWTLALHRYLPDRTLYAEPVLLCHGVAANRLQFDLADDRSLARTLAGKGFDVWSLELRGHGMSSRPAWGTRHGWDFAFDDHLDKDVPAAVELVRKVSDQPKVFWIGHSMGGMLGYAHAGDAARDELAGLVAIAAPVRLDRCTGLRRLRAGVRLLALGRVARFKPLLRFFAPLFGRPPGFVARPFLLPGGMEPSRVRQAMVNLVENSPTATLRQLGDWLDAGVFRSLDGQRDYLKRLENVRVGVLLIAAEQDRLATPQSVAAAYERIRSQDKQLRVFGTDSGDDVDFGHGDVLLGVEAAEVAYPEIVEWLRRRATPLSDSASTADGAAKAEGEDGER